MFKKIGRKTWLKITATAVGGGFLTLAVIGGPQSGDRAADRQTEAEQEYAKAQEMVWKTQRDAVEQMLEATGISFGQDYLCGRISKQEFEDAKDRAIETVSIAFGGSSFTWGLAVDRGAKHPLALRCSPFDQAVALKLVEQRGAEMANAFELNATTILQRQQQAARAMAAKPSQTTQN